MKPGTTLKLENFCVAKSKLRREFIGLYSCESSKSALQSKTNYYYNKTILFFILKGIKGGKHLEVQYFLPLITSMEFLKNFPDFLC